MSISLCGNLDVNTGAIACDNLKGNPVMPIFGGASFSSSDTADTATFDAAFVAKMKLARSSSTKLYPLPVVQGVTDKTEAAKYGSLGYGLQFKLLRSKPGYEFDVLAGTALEKQLIKFDGQQIPMFLLDDKSIIWGSGDGTGELEGINVLVGVEPRPFGDAQNPKSTKITVSFVDGADGVENLYGMATDLTTADLKGLNDVVLSEKSSHSSNVFHIKGLVKGSIIGQDVNIAEVFGATLASASLWVATVVVGSVAHTITSVALNSASDGYDITLDSTQYAALSSGAKIDINLAPPATLYAAGVTEVEGIKVRCTK
jgi:hypothetical protein